MLSVIFMLHFISLIIHVSGPRSAKVGALPIEEHFTMGECRAEMVKAHILKRKSTPDNQIEWILEDNWDKTIINYYNNGYHHLHQIVIEYLEAFDKDARLMAGTYCEKFLPDNQPNQ
ncbi:uncharacterized protein LOC100575642 [Acyrthosiphon pisum]|uniref:Uncharacterized protein n=1 Tax=Acyrthosiphon pisum TaxID=7029 RepID=A0A8R2ABY3_ACYPI|nr:uncharacterized protein LOC100575642 [Acyrthosiphon pisum]|eukprot:XP_003247317.1 PREDICTED: uncharacterized protein LOC100575642 [Acyrthosiphon pisum]